MLIVPNKCYEEYGKDLDGCSRQESEGCKGCKCARAIKTNREAHEEAAGMNLEPMFFSLKGIYPDADNFPTGKDIDKIIREFKFGKD